MRLLFVLRWKWVLVIVLALLAAGLGAAPASAAAATRIVPIAGTGRYLVYGKYTPTPFGAASVRLYSLDSAGRTRSLGAVTTASPTRLSATAAGSVLVVQKDGDESYRWNLATGSRTTIGAQTIAAPSGYIEAGTNGETGNDVRQAVILVSARGRTILGVPFPNKENTDGTFRLSSGTAGVTITDDNGHIRFIAFAKPGAVRSLHTYNRGANGSSVNCSASTSTVVACTGFDEETTTLLGIRLDRRSVSEATPDCFTGPAVLRSAIAWVDCASRLAVLHADDSVTTSRATFGAARPVSAFGKVVLQSRSGTSLQVMTSASSTPRTVVVAR